MWWSRKNLSRREQIRKERPDTFLRRWEQLRASGVLTSMAIAAGFVVQSPGERRSNLVTGHVREQRPGFRLGEPRERQLVREGLASQVREEVGNLITVWELDIAVAHDDEQGRVRRRAHDMSQQQHGGPVCPVQVVEHEKGRGTRGDTGHERCDRLEQPIALGLRVAHRWHVSHRNVDRPPSEIRRTGAPQRRQGCPSRP